MEEWERGLSWPIFAIAQREAVEQDGDALLVTDAQFLIEGELIDDAGRLTGEPGLLLFSSAERACECLRRKPRPDALVATFRDPQHLIAFLGHHARRGMRKVILDRHTDGYIIFIDVFAEVVARLH